MHAEHIEAQKLGRTKYYEMYDIKVCEVRYHHHHERKTEAAPGLDPAPIQGPFKGPKESS